MKSLARSHLYDVIDVLTLLEEIQERRKATEVEGCRSKIQQVIVHPHQFSKNRSQILAARGEFNVQQFLDRVVPGNFVCQR